MLDLTSVDLLDAFTRELKLCKLEPDEHVVVLSEPTSRGDYVAAAFGAAKRAERTSSRRPCPAAIRRPPTARAPARVPG